MLEMSYLDLQDHSVDVVEDEATIQERECAVLETLYSSPEDALVDAVEDEAMT